MQPLDLVREGGRTMLVHIIALGTNEHVRSRLVPFNHVVFLDLAAVRFFTPTFGVLHKQTERKGRFRCGL
jgi:hypothetical protein